VASPGPDDFSGGLVRSEIITILTAMITRYKSGRPHIKRQKVMPVSHILANCSTIVTNGSRLCSSL
jgi:hypothetical protein